MKRNYFSPQVRVVGIMEVSIICASSPIQKKATSSSQTSITTANAPSTVDEMEIVKQLNPLTTDVTDLRERLKSLREMSALFKCPISKLREFYINDVKKNYDGKYENFHYLPEAYKYMADKAYDVAPSVGLNPKNTSYGIMCDWLSDFMEEERQRFIDTNQVKCIRCGSRNIGLNFFKNHFVCNSCKTEFGGI